MFWIFAGIFGVIALALVLLTLLSVFVAICPVPKVPLMYNLRNLQVRWLTTSITAAAIALVVALMTVMLMFVKGMEALTEGSSVPGNVVITEEGSTDEAFSKLGYVTISEMPSEVQAMVAKTKYKQDGKDVEDYMVSREVYAIVTQLIPTSIEGEFEKRFLQMRGIENPVISAEIHGITLLQDPKFKEPSRWFDTTRSKQVVLGYGVASRLGKDQGKNILEPGDKVNLREEEWTVVGVMSPLASTFGSEVWTDYQIVQKYFGRENNFSSYVLRVTDPKKIEAVTKVLKDRDKVSFSFQAMSEKDYYSKLSQSNQGFTMAINFVAIIMAIGGMLGVMITMFAAVSQRAKDIGVLRLLGYRRWQILCSFLLESLVIGLVAGILGVALGCLAQGVEMNSIVSSGQGGGKSIVLKLTMDRSILIQGIVFSVIMGIVGGIFPAISAMRLRPLESLR